MPFLFENTPIADLKVVEMRRFGDERGFFEETYKKEEFFAAGICENFVQDNHSCSNRGVLRGIHFQREPKAQGKLVSVISGAVFDVAVDLRKNSPSFGQWFGIELTAENKKMLYIPAGFGHAFLALADNTHFCYKCTDYYSKDHDGGVRFDDPKINIDWKKYFDGELIVSEKDIALPFLSEANL